MYYRYEDRLKLFIANSNTSHIVYSCNRIVSFIYIGCSLASGRYTCMSVCNMLIEYSPTFCLHVSLLMLLYQIQYPILAAQRRYYNTTKHSQFILVSITTNTVAQFILFSKPTYVHLKNMHVCVMLMHVACTNMQICLACFQQIKF